MRPSYRAGFFLGCGAKARGLSYPLGFFGAAVGSKGQEAILSLRAFWAAVGSKGPEAIPGLRWEAKAQRPSYLKSNRKPCSLRILVHFCSQKVKSQALVPKILGSFLFQRVKSQALVPKILGSIFALKKVKSQALVPKILGSFVLSKSQIASPGP